MYRPAAFSEDRLDILRELMRSRPFATIVSAGPAGLMASHAPLEFEARAGSPGSLIGHLARANPHCQELDAAHETLAVFLGPQAYISPSWYASKAEHGRVVPTWNYAAIHVYGKARTFSDPERLRGVVEKLTAARELGRPEPWAVSDAPDDYISGALNAIVGFEIEIERIEGKWKMSQNRPAEDRRGVIAGLRGGSEEERAVADLIPE